MDERVSEKAQIATTDSTLLISDRGYGRAALPSVTVLCYCIRATKPAGDLTPDGFVQTGRPADEGLTPAHNY